MCQSCYDKWGRPTEWNDEISRAVDLVETIYQWHPAGGLLHIVLDDWNIGDEKVAWVESYVAQEAGGWEEEEPEMVAATRELLPLLKAMSVAERASTLAYTEGFAPLPEPS